VLFPVLSEAKSRKKENPRTIGVERGSKQGHLQTLNTKGNPMSSIPHVETGARRLLERENTKSLVSPLKLEVRIESPPNEIVAAWITHHHLFIDKVISDVEKTSSRRVLRSETIEVLREHERICGSTARTTIF
jgi:hypothetical protein